MKKAVEGVTKSRQRISFRLRTNQISANAAAANHAMPAGKSRFTLASTLYHRMVAYSTNSGLIPAGTFHFFVQKMHRQTSARNVIMHPAPCKKASKKATLLLSGNARQGTMHTGPMK